MKYHAFKSNEGPNGSEPESEFMASNLEMLKGFIETYWLNAHVPDETWKKMLNGWAITFPQDGTIHIEVED